MRKKRRRKTSPDGNRVHLYLLVPVNLYDWLEAESAAANLKNVQEQIIHILRLAHQDARQEQAA